MFSHYSHLHLFGCWKEYVNLMFIVYGLSFFVNCLFMSLTIYRNEGQCLTVVKNTGSEVRPPGLKFSSNTNTKTSPSLNFSFCEIKITVPSPSDEMMAWHVTHALIFQELFIRRIFTLCSPYVLQPLFPVVTCLSILFIVDFGRQKL